MFSVFSNGCSDCSTRRVADEVLFDNNIHILLEDGKYGKNWLDIIEDHAKNTTILQTRRNENVL